VNGFIHTCYDNRFHKHSGIFAVCGLTGVLTAATPPAVFFASRQIKNYVKLLDNRILI